MLRGVSHVHTTYSFDGKLSPAELQAFFASKDIQFVLLSEHVESLEAASINALIRECERVSTSQCCLIPGIEVDDLNLLIFGIRDVRPYDSIEKLIRVLHAQGALFGYAHPVKKRAVPPEVMEMLDGFEVWNTRHDGKLMPRQTSVTQFRNLLQENPTIRPLAGLDFHKTSDYAPVCLQVECDIPTEILPAIRAGRYSLRANGRAVQVYPGRRSPLAWVVAARGALYTYVYDLAVFQHRWLAQRGITVPRALKMALKKIF